MIIAAAGAAFLLALAVTVHNIEEMIWLPGFRHPPEYGLNVEAAPLRIAAIAIALLFWLSAAGLALGWPLEAIVAGFAIAMIVNAIVPHLALSVLLGRYHPGTASALILVVPASLVYLHAAGAAEHWHDFFFLAGAIAGFAGLAAAVPLLLSLARRLTE